MARLEWDAVGERLYETGVSHGVVYPKDDSGKYPKGEAWNGLTGVTKSPSGAEETPLYANNVKYLSLYSAEELGGTIESYMYPDSFAECDGSKELETDVSIGQQPRKAFGMTYRTILGNDTSGNSYGYKLHIIYGMMVSPTEQAYNTVNADPDVNPFSWEFTTTPVKVAGCEPTSSITITSTKVNATKLKALEDILYGTDEDEPRLPLPDEIATLIKVS